MRARNWCFTLNNPTEQEEDNLQTLDCRYLVFGREQGEDKKTPHFQGYIEFDKPVRMSAIKKRTSDRIHLEQRRGTPAQAIRYCKKDGDIFEKGKHKVQGYRTDLDQLVSLAKTKRTFEEFCDADSRGFRYDRSYKSYRACVDKRESKPFRIVTLHVFIGPTGSGKTRTVYEECKKKGLDVYKLGPNRISSDILWFQDYDREPVLLIDEFTGWMKYSQLLMILDGYQLALQQKGGGTYAFYTDVYITSNEEVDEWYNAAVIGDNSALWRRINNRREDGTESPDIRHF